MRKNMRKLFNIVLKKQQKSLEEEDDKSKKMKEFVRKMNSVEGYESDSDCIINIVQNNRE